jgi:hypothetical protein
MKWFDRWYPCGKKREKGIEVKRKREKERELNIRVTQCKHQSLESL